jgi:hypothetical protein
MEKKRLRNYKSIREDNIKVDVTQCVAKIQL